jgi:alcohol dehydrogenase YqhD (iron-dependent ADH family)
MKSFYFYNPTKIYFGEGSANNLTKEFKGVKKALVAYGGGSIKKNGIYEDVVNRLKGVKLFELGGITPNPRDEKVYEGIEICKSKDIDFILAVGGGSVVDCSKIIAAGAKIKKDFWKTLFVKNEKLKTAIPLGVVLTMSGTGTEMNPNAVITQWETKTKAAYSDLLIMPKFSVLDPTYTYSLPKNQIVYGVIDAISHIFEGYFSTPDEPNLSDDISEVILRNLISNLHIAVNNPSDYNARANIMWSCTMALNGIAQLSKTQDWLSHQIEHTLSAYYDIAHGAGLAIVHPNYLKYIYENHTERFVRFAKNVWGVDDKMLSPQETALTGIDCTQRFFKEMEAPLTLSEVNIPRDAIPELASRAMIFPTSYSNLTVKDVETILNMCAE